MYTKVRVWLPFAVVITAFCGLTYLVTQQSYRMSANDPQIQMAEDISTALTKGETADSVLSEDTVNIASSLAPFVIVYDANAHVIGSTAVLSKSTPDLPVGVLNYVRLHGQTRITWEPQPGVRSAIVVMYHGGENSGYVLAGRSLREVEKRIDQLTMQVVFVWCLALFASFLVISVMPDKKHQR